MRIYRSFRMALGCWLGAFVMAFGFAATSGEPARSRGHGPEPGALPACPAFPPSADGGCECEIPSVSGRWSRDNSSSPIIAAARAPALQGRGHRAASSAADSTVAAAWNPCRLPRCHAAVQLDHRAVRHAGRCPRDKRCMGAVPYSLQPCPAAAQLHHAQQHAFVL